MSVRKRTDRILEAELLIPIPTDEFNKLIEMGDTCYEGERKTCLLCGDILGQTPPSYIRTTYVHDKDCYMLHRSKITSGTTGEEFCVVRAGDWAFIVDHILRMQYTYVLIRDLSVCRFCEEAISNLYHDRRREHTKECPMHIVLRNQEYLYDPGTNR